MIWHRGCDKFHEYERLPHYRPSARAILIGLQIVPCYIYILLALIAFSQMFQM